MIKSINEFKKYLNAKAINEGSGNARIRYNDQFWPTYYIEYYDSTDEDGDEIPDANDMFMDDFIGNVEHFKSVKLTRVPDEWIGNNQVIKFESDTFKVVVVDNEWALGVGVIPSFYDENDEGEEVIPNGFNEDATKFFNELNSIYKLHTATSAWTSRAIDNDETITVNEDLDTNSDEQVLNDFMTVLYNYLDKKHSNGDDLKARILELIDEIKSVDYDGFMHWVKNGSTLYLRDELLNKTTYRGNGNTPEQLLDFNSFATLDTIGMYYRKGYSVDESIINESNLPDGMVKALDDIDERRPNRMKRPGMSYNAWAGNPYTSSGRFNGVYIQDEAESVMQDKYGRERGTKLWEASLNAPQRGAMFKMADDVMKEKQWLMDKMNVQVRDYWDVSYYSLWKAWMASEGLTYKVDSEEEIQAKADAKRAAEEAAKQQALAAKQAQAKADLERTLTQIKNDNLAVGLPVLQADAKDKQRVADMFSRDSWPTNAANTMANAIKDVNKAVRRGQAVVDYVEENNLPYYKLDIAKIFFKRAKLLKTSGN